MIKKMRAWMKFWWAVFLNKVKSREEVDQISKEKLGKVVDAYQSMGQALHGHTLDADDYYALAALVTANAMIMGSRRNRAKQDRVAIIVARMARKYIDGGLVRKGK